jgi:hypothetical protein
MSVAIPAYRSLLPVIIDCLLPPSPSLEHTIKRCLLQVDLQLALAAQDSEYLFPSCCVCLNIRGC